MAVDVVGFAQDAPEWAKLVTGAGGSWSLEQMGHVLSDLGEFGSEELAKAAIESSPEFWYETTTAVVDDTLYDIYQLQMVDGGWAEAVSSTTETALEVAQNSSLMATNTEISGGAVTIADTSGGAGTSFGFKALMSMDVGIMGAAIAPVLGVTLGAELYSANPELWGKISQTLLPFCYEDTTMAPVWAGIDAIGNWEISVCRNAVNALRDLFKEEEIPVRIPGEKYATSDLATNIQQPIPYHTDSMSDIVVKNIYEDGTLTITPDNGAKYVIVKFSHDSRLCIFVLSGTVVCTTVTANHGTNTRTFTPDRTFTYDNRTVRYWEGNGIENAVISLWGSPQLEADVTVEYGDYFSPISNIAWTIEYGTSSDIGPGEYPDGVERWEGDIPSKYFSDPIIDEDGNPVDTVPISPPMNIPENWKPGTPAPSGNPQDQPYPDVIYDPNKQISPYISSTPLPDISIYPTPTTNTNPNPDSDPSQPTPPPSKIIDVVPLPPAPSGDSPVPNMPTTSAPFSSSVGLVTVYHPNDAQLYAFESWLWVTYADATIDKIWNNPFDGVITLFELYCTPTDIGTRNIHCGFLDSGVNSPIISRYTEIDCGSLGIPEWYGNYLDYSPYTKAHIYLPFIGIQELNPDDIVGHGVNVTYRIDEYNGSCIAMITVAKSTTVNGEEVEYSNTMYQFSGNCAVELPITGGSQAAIKAGMMQADAYQAAGLVSTGANLLGGIGSALMGSLGGAISGVAGAASSYAYAQANYLSNMLSGKSTVQKSGSFGASHGALGIKTPFITITRPKQIQVANYEKLYGYPAHKMVTIGACTGFLRCREVNVVSATANDEEKALIEQLLKAGVYVTE